MNDFIQDLFIKLCYLKTFYNGGKNMGYSIFDETMVDLSWDKLDELIKGEAVVLLPTGVIEAHGPHMCLGVDTYGSYIKCKLVKEILESKEIKTLIAPPYYWGINNMTGAFPGSFTVRKSTMKALIYDILASLNRWGVKYVFNINHHGDSEHCATLFEAIKEARIGIGIRAFSIISEFDAKRFAFTGQEHHVLVYNEAIDNTSNSPQSEYIDIHAGQGETSMMLKYFPNQVNVKKAKTLKPTNLKFTDLLEWRKGWSDARKLTPQCYFGDPASCEKVDVNCNDEALQISSLIYNFLNNQ